MEPQADFDEEVPTQTVPVGPAQSGWLELLKDHDITILYHPGKANVVANALNRKAVSISLAYILVGERPLASDCIRERQYDDPHSLVLRDTVWHGGAKPVNVGDDGFLRMQGRICLPNVDEIRELILEETHSSRHSVHPGAAKMCYFGYLTAQVSSYDVFVLVSGAVLEQAVREAYQPRLAHLETRGRSIDVRRP
uniref:Uncharacterized protein LOC104231955 n=1 Tax=Nicotiana sylvestris TaxID=4096 RepID=A0A1U7XA59_NICSY|nr:PREDICTED: uncharacterized protein LOC104231955 [Nicotiana sylvestris]